ncbi:hypothetical protein HXW74_09955 [Tetragenococcus halophilus]|nr:hypothetical protein [Tetragenococcus halophilus]
MKKDLKEKTEDLDQKTDELLKRDKQNKVLVMQNKELKIKVQNIENSNLWKLTKPLRGFKQKINR